jgi:hypothetical protein
LAWVHLSNKNLDVLHFCPEHLYTSLSFINRGPWAYIPKKGHIQLYHPLKGTIIWQPAGAV